MKNAKIFCLKNLAIFAGVALACMALMDAAFQWQNADYGRGVGSQSASEFLFAFLLLGIIIGMVGGIALSFAYFMWKEKKLASEPDDFQMLLDELTREEPFHRDDRHGAENEEKGEKLEPWERSSDWWKGEEDK